MSGMTTRAMASPSSGGGGGGAVVVVPGSSSGSVVVAVDDGPEVPSPRLASNCSSRSSWERASATFVPHSWYATKSSTIEPIQISRRPTPPSTRASSTAAAYGLGRARRPSVPLGSLMTPAATPPAVSFRAAVVLLDRFPALAGVDLDVAPGEVVLLRGPN